MNPLVRGGPEAVYLMDLHAAAAACLTCIEKSNVLLAQCQAAPMSECDLGELSKLIEIEIDLGFNFDHG